MGDLGFTSLDETPEQVQRKTTSSGAGVLTSTHFTLPSLPIAMFVGILCLLTRCILLEMQEHKDVVGLLIERRTASSLFVLGWWRLRSSQVLVPDLLRHG